MAMQPREGLPIEEFHDWYNNEHGPTRLRLPFVTNGFRFRATDLDAKPDGKTPEEWPEWLAVYDITDMSELQSEAYLRLRTDEVKSQREKDVMSKIMVDRRLFDFVEEVKSEENFVPLENFLDAPKGNEQPRLMNCVIQTIQPGQEEEFHKWYREEHMPMMSKIPGFLRIRRFKTSSIGATPSTPTQWVSLIEWAKSAAGTPDHVALNSTPWRMKAQKEYVAEKSYRQYRHYYTFGPAPRDLQPLDNAKPFVSPDGLTKVMPHNAASDAASASASAPAAAPASALAGTIQHTHAVESYITTADGVDLHFRLEGSGDQHAPLIVLSNCILADYSIWDGFLERFFARDGNKAKYRVVRYLTRGRTSDIGGAQSQPITVDTLSSDIITILDALRIKKAAAVIGVSLGGATVLNTALKFPNRTHTFIACDTNPLAPASNPKAWEERIALAKSENAVSGPNNLAAAEGEPIVGRQLADITVKRWFVPANYETSPNKERAQKITEMVANNSLVGFEAGAKALYAYDLRDAMKASDKYGAFVVGSGDGVLPKTMKEMAELMGGKSEYLVVDNAGHLPMVEQPATFEEIVSKFLSKA